MNGLQRSFAAKRARVFDTGEFGIMRRTLRTYLVGFCVMTMTINPALACHNCGGGGDWRGGHRYGGPAYCGGYYSQASYGGYYDGGYCGGCGGCYEVVDDCCGGGCSSCGEGETVV